MPALSARFLQQVADSRAAEALALLQLGHFSGAYYPSGYALECGLKALIASKFEAGVIPDKKRVERIYTHKLDQLLKLAGIEGELETLADGDLYANWQTAIGWSEDSRYEIVSEKSARELITAICDSENGVFQWVRSKW